jgi:hypothetical protein
MRVLPGSCVPQFTFCMERHILRDECAGFRRQVSPGRSPDGFRHPTMQVEPSSEMRKLLQAASKLQKKKGDSYLGVRVRPYLGLGPLSEALHELSCTLLSFTISLRRAQMGESATYTLLQVWTRCSSRCSTRQRLRVHWRRPAYRPSRWQRPWTSCAARQQRCDVESCRGLSHAEHVCCTCSPFSGFTADSNNMLLVPMSVPRPWHASPCRWTRRRGTSSSRRWPSTPST